MWEIKKTSILIIFLLVAILSGKAAAEKRIGILMFSEQARYLMAARGFMDALKEGGFTEDRLTVTRKQADANKAKAAELVEQFASQNIDLIFTVGTHATIAVTQKIKDSPIVFAEVYDPVGSGIAKDWESSGNNTTGVSTRLPMSDVVDSLKRFAPVKRLGVLYTPGEKNSEAQLRDLEGIQTASGIKVIPAPASNTEEVAQILPLIMKSTDAIYITGSNLVNRELASIVDMTTRTKAVTVTHLDDLVEQGVLLGVVPDSYLSGHEAGKMALKILFGAPPSSIPIEIPKDYQVVINLKTARAGGFQAPPDFMKTIERTIE
jgi:putative ABC transport system substrate-binding protein